VGGDELGNSKPGIQSAFQKPISVAEVIASHAIADRPFAVRLLSGDRRARRWFSAAKRSLANMAPHKAPPPTVRVAASVDGERTGSDRITGARLRSDGPVMPRAGLCRAGVRTA